MIDRDFLGACRDLGAQKSVWEIVQAKAYTQFNPDSITWKRYPMDFQFRQQVV